jgi:hypothetical protein
MLQDTSTCVVTALILMMVAVLFYAVETLYGMKGKVVYPLLRVRLRDGDYSMMVVSNTAPSSGQLSLLSAHVC